MFDSNSISVIDGRTNTVVAYYPRRYWSCRDSGQSNYQQDYNVNNASNSVSVITGHLNQAIEKVLLDVDLLD